MKCSYVGCETPATHVVNFTHLDHPLCDEHAKPKYHPADLHDRIKPISTYGTHDEEG